MPCKVNSAETRQMLSFIQEIEAQIGWASEDTKSDTTRFLKPFHSRVEEHGWYTTDFQFVRTSKRKLKNAVYLVIKENPLNHGDRKVSAVSAL